MNYRQLNHFVSQVLQRKCSCHVGGNVEPCPDNWHTWRRYTQQNRLAKRLASCFVGKDEEFYSSILTVNIGVAARTWIQQGNALGLPCSIDDFDKNTNRVMVKTHNIPVLNSMQQKFLADLLLASQGAQPS